MPSINNKKNRQHKKASDERRARAYMIVKALAQRSGHMKHQRDTQGLDRFMNEFRISGDEVDWFEAMAELLK